jgi:hypothetical protein
MLRPRNGQPPIESPGYIANEADPLRLVQAYIRLNPDCLSPPSDA